MTPVVLLLIAGLAQQPAAPRPFPRPNEPASRPNQQPPATPQTPAPAAPPATPAAPTPAAAVETPAAAADNAAPSEDLLGIKIYPSALFLGSFDAGRGQRFYLFGSGSSFADLVTYYRNILKQRGELIFDAPATHEFDVGRFREDTMAFPPGVTIKEYKSEISAGYPNPNPDGQPARFPTIIQFVPVPVGDR